MVADSTLVSAHAQGSDLLCTFRQADGSIKNIVVDYFKPYFYAPLKETDRAVVVPIDSVKKIQARHPADIRKYRGTYGEYTYESDVMFENRFFIDHPKDINNEIKWNVTWLDIEARMVTYTKSGKRQSHTIQDLRDGKTYITAITKLDTLYKRIVTYTITPDIDKDLIIESVMSKNVTRLNVDNNTSLTEATEKKAAAYELLKDFTLDVIVCEDERELMTLFLDDMREFQPDVVAGWNVGFDYVTIFNRAKRLGLAHKLTMFDPLKYKANVKIRTTDEGIEMIDYFTPGYYVTDYMDVYKKRRGKVENSYSLDYITNAWKVEIPKIKHGYPTVDALQDGDATLFTYYNLIDVIAMYLLDLKTGYMDTSIMLCNMSHCPFAKCTSNRFIVDSYLISKLKELNLVRISPHHRDVPSDKKYGGGYVNAEQGYYNEYFTDLDFTSMYPMIMMSLNISPDTYESHPANPDDYYKAANGAHFRKDKRGIVPLLLDGLFKQRKADKNEAMRNKNLYDQTGDSKYYDLYNLYNNLQLAEKVILNSFYGVMGDKKYALYETAVAEGVTTSGQKLIKFAISELTKGGYKVIYTDTDSCYVALGPAEPGELVLAEDTLDTIVKYVQEIDNLYNFINAKFNIVAAEMNIEANTHRFEMKSELLGRNIFIMDKKMYAFNELLSEGKIADLRKFKTVAEKKQYLMDANLKPEIVVKGMVIAKSVCPPAVKKYAGALLTKLISGEINKQVFILAMEQVWEKKIVPDGRKDPLQVAKLARLNKIPAVENVVSRAIKRYNDNHNIPIDLGEKVYFIKALGDEEAVVYKMGEFPDKIAVDFKQMYESTFRKLKENFVKIANM